MAMEIDFPCPFCGATYHFNTDDLRMKVPCPACGKELVMPHGRPPTADAVGMTGEVPKFVYGLHSGGMSQDEWDKLFRAEAIEAIRRWEELIAKGASREVCRTAEMAVYDAIWSFPHKRFDLDGKRYKAISRAAGISVSVTPVPQKKPKRSKATERLTPVLIFSRNDAGKLVLSKTNETTLEDIREIFGLMQELMQSAR